MNKRIAKQIVGKMTEREKGHYEGVLAALSVLSNWCDVTYADVVRNCGPRELVAVSVVNEDGEFSGLDSAGFSKLKRGYESRFVK